MFEEVKMIRKQENFVEKKILSPLYQKIETNFHEHHGFNKILNSYELKLFGFNSDNVRAKTVEFLNMLERGCAPIKINYKNNGRDIQVLIPSKKFVEFLELIES